MLYGEDKTERVVYFVTLGLKMSDKLVDYSLYDVKGDRYDVTVTQREADVFDRYPNRMYAKINELKNKGQQPSRRAGASRAKKTASGGCETRKRPVAVASTPFKPNFNSTTFAENQKSTISPLASPLAKKVRGNKSPNSSRRMLPFLEGSSHADLNTSFEQLQVDDEDQVYQDDTVIEENDNSTSNQIVIGEIRDKSTLNHTVVVVDTSEKSAANHSTFGEIKSKLTSNPTGVVENSLDKPASTSNHFGKIKNHPRCDLGGIFFGNRIVQTEVEDQVPNQSLLASPHVLVDNGYKLEFSNDNKDTVKDYVLKRMCDSGFIEPGNNCIVSASVEGPATIIVTFQTSEYADLAVLLEDVSFFGAHLNFKKYIMDNERNNNNVTAVNQQSLKLPDISDICSDEESPDLVILKNSPTVKVDCSNLNVAITDDNKDKLKDFIHKKMYEAGFIKEDECCIFGVAVTEATSLILTFRTSEEANLAVYLEDTYYKGNKLILSKCTTDSENNIINGNEKSSQQTTSSSDMNIYSGEGSYIYAQLLIKYRKDFPKSGGHGAIMNIIHSKLLKKGIKCSLTDLRVKRERMKSMFNKKKKFGKTNHEFYAPGQVIFENADISLIRETKYDPQHLGNDSSDDSSAWSEDEDHEDLLKFAKVATWTNKASVALIDTVIDHTVNRKDGTRNTHFWKKIEIRMVQQKFYYSGEQCERRVDALKTIYRNHFDEHVRSGAEGPIFTEKYDKDTKTLMERVGELLQLKGHLGVQATVTFAAGVKPQERRFDKSSSGSRIGRERPNALSRSSSSSASRRPPTKAQLEERRVAAIEMKARALDRLSRMKCGEPLDDDSNVD